MNLSFTNKVILVTGGTSGIGKSTAIAFAESGRTKSNRLSTSEKDRRSVQH
jgi:NAD(P)-dependent dehydrogenase (short-subunit alcohol dehydrogenase family)